MLILIQAAIPYQVVSLKTIKAVLDAIDGLEAEYTIAPGK